MYYLMRPRAGAKAGARARVRAGVEAADVLPSLPSFLPFFLPSSLPLSLPRVLHDQKQYSIGHQCHVIRIYDRPRPLDLLWDDIPSLYTTGLNFTFVLESMKYQLLF